MRTTSIIAGAALAATAAAENYLGFNSGSEFPDRSAKFKQDFVDEFKAAKGLENAPGDFTAVRLYTSIQAYAQDDPIEAFEAAIETDTKILLGVWASGTTEINKELTALDKAVKKFGKSFTDLVVGISIGSEDLYRISVTGLKNDPTGVGNTPDNIVSFIDDFKTKFKDTGLANAPVGHVDTWDAYTNTSNAAVLEAVDWIGVNSFPYYQVGEGNDIKNAAKLFDESYEKTLGVANGKPVWVTETGWPSSGPKSDEAVASVENAKYFWDEIGCRQLFGKVSTFWYILRDSNSANKMKFTITENLTKPLFDLTCPTTFETDEKASSSAAASATSSPVTSGTATNGSSSATPTSDSGNGNGSGSGNGNGNGSGSNNGNGNGSGSDSDSGSDADSTQGSDDSTASQAPGSGDEDEVEQSAASSLQVFTIAAYSTFAVAAGFFALF